MSRHRITTIAYVTSSTYKVEEIEIFVRECSLADGTPIHEVVRFEIRDVSIPERLEVDLEKMVAAEVTEAYSRTRIPCIVEHAGLVFDEYNDKSYPGGLTKAMWNTLGDRFIVETKSANRRVVARAVVGYCDGMRIRTFVGETAGMLAENPRGDRAFYWDTVLIPDDARNVAPGQTYAEIVQNPNLGLKHKIMHLSQSARAFRKFVDYLHQGAPTELWG